MKIKRSLFLLLIIIIIGSFLRLYKLSQNPPSLYWDEVSLGYNAYSILKTGKDEHGEIFPTARFIAFGDFKPPGYIYATVPSVAFFGLNEFAVRLPSAIAGIFLILVSYFLAKEIFKNETTALITGFFVAVSPWSIQLSRGAFEANLAAFFNATAILFFLKLQKNKGYYLIISIIFFILSFYTFNANRIIAPLLVIFLSVWKIKMILAEKKWLIVSLILAVILLKPSFSYLTLPESRVRFQEVSIFTNLNILNKSNQRISLHQNSLLGKLLHNRRFAYTREFLSHFFDHFKAEFLFISGDKNPRLSVQSTGELYLTSLPFLILGILMVIKKFGKKSWLFFGWLFISIFPAALAKETPHALRTASTLPIYELIFSYGLYYFFAKVIINHSLNKLLKYAVVFFLIFNVYYYLHNYYIHYPLDWSGEWQYGYKQAVDIASQLEDQYDYIVVTENLGRPYIYFLFYNKVNPEYFQTTRIANRDWFGFWYVYGFGKYRFGLNQLPNLTGKILVIGQESDTKNLPNIIKTIYSPKGKIIFRIGST